MYRIGIDVGGTFTDLVAVDDAGRVVLAKAASTPKDPSIGVLDGLGRLAAVLGIDTRGLLQATERIVHGTTVATNALLEHKGARVGLLTTEGHRDVIEMREGLKDDRYNLRLPAPEPLVPRARRIGVRERLRADGRVEIPLDRRSLDRAIAQLTRDGVEAVAVCYFHAYRDGRHEVTTRTALTKALPGVYVSLSSEVLPQIKEYERVCTTVVNAYVGPILSRYLARLGTRLRDAGYAGAVLIMQSHGGVAPIDEAVRLAAGAVLSGPAGGVAGSRYCARLLDAGNLIPFDMGGTSTDISLIVSGEPQLAVDRAVAAQRVSLPSLDIVSLGAGGGSIAWVDAGGILHVGPESAGADPGPACYGKGGTAPTVTDANLVLGYLDPANFLGGQTRLDVQAARHAVDALAARLRTDGVAAADGIHQVVNTRMAEGIRLVSVRRGVDPRRFALLAFGGAAGLHITDLARRLEIRRVVLPRVAAVLSAWGMLATDLRYEVVRTHIGDVKHLGAAALRRVFAQMEAEGRRRLSPAFTGPVRAHRAVDMRYGEQIFEIPVSLDGLDLAAPDLLKEVVERFHRRHEELYTYSVRDQEVVLVNARVAVVGELPALPQEPALPARPPAPPRARRRVYLGEWREVPVFDLDAVAPGQRLEGPAIVEAATTTVLLRAGERAVVTPLGWLDIAVAS
ncbi:MAG: hydantoinase/oxoprolinase family protein [Candidatus Rokubacteria bacterium]|nr:hydantoinase/oxoprolinase family protein [Candidatus Rokubacteria bacterium]